MRISLSLAICLSQFFVSLASAGEIGYVDLTGSSMFDMSVPVDPYLHQPPYVFSGRKYLAVKHEKHSFGVVWQVIGPVGLELKQSDSKRQSNGRPDFDLILNLGCKVTIDAGFNEGGLIKNPLNVIKEFENGFVKTSCKF